jgi:hypothetical protein
MSDEKIPGTRVPDTAIHRASMWLEYLKFGDARRNAGVEKMTDDTFELFVAAAQVNFTAEQMKEAAQFYGLNMLQMTVGNRVNFMIPSPDGEGLMDGRAVFASLWIDAFMHGVATARGKHGPSNLEAEKIPAGMEWGCEECDFHTFDEQAALLHSDVARHSLALRPAP